jgi:hypothetical protein
MRSGVHSLRRRFQRLGQFNGAPVFGAFLAQLSSLSTAHRPTGWAAGLLAVSLYLLLPRSSRAEGSASYKFQSWQEDDGRVRVDSHYGMVEQALPAEAKLKLVGLIDSIAGATPTGQLPLQPNDPLPLSNLTDRRKAWQAEIGKPFGRVTATAGYAHSQESDYVSDGWSLNTVTEFNQKNTSVLFGVAGTSDEVRVFFQPTWAEKRTVDLIAGVTQLLNPETSITANLSFGRATGYLSDPYKLIQKHVEVGPGLILLRTFGENRPDEREKWIGFLSVNRAFTSLGAALEGSYRLYHDSFGITSHTVGLEWFQQLGSDRLLLRPSVRWYEQTEADFYYTTLDGTAIQPSNRPNPSGPFYSADYRLSHMRTLNLGLKLVWVAMADRLSVDVSYERYTMDGRDNKTHRGAYADADVYTVGARFSW